MNAEAALRFESAGDRADLLVELLAVGWALTEPNGQPATANPQAMEAATGLPGLRDHPAIKLIAGLRKAVNRDSLVKLLVRSAYGVPGSAPSGLRIPFAERFTHAMLDLCDSHGKALREVLEPARLAMYQQLDPMLSFPSAADDMRALTGQSTDLDISITPSLLLPPPQDGRHGVQFSVGNRQVVHQYFGFPLQEDPARYGITRHWLRGGCWHYAIENYLDQHWERLSAALQSQPGLEEQWCEALGDSRGNWLRSVRSHLSAALTRELWHRVGYPADPYLILAEGQRLLLTAWFVDWLRRGLNGFEGDLGKYLLGLPMALGQAHEEWSALARAPRRLHDSINLALMPLWRNSPVLVFPDEWSADTVRAVHASWSRLGFPALRLSEWEARPERRDAPAIAFGSPTENPLVAGVLRERGLALNYPDLANPVVIALGLPTDQRSTWLLAIGSWTPAARTEVTLDMVLGLSYSYAVFDGRQLVHGERSPDCPVLAFSKGA